MKTEMDGKLEIMEERLARLEQQNRRWMVLAALSTLALLVILAIGASRPGPRPGEPHLPGELWKPVSDLVRTRRLEIVDNRGYSAITLDSDLVFGGTLEINGLRETPGIEALGGGAGFPMFRLLGPGGHNGIFLTVLPGGGAELTLYDPDKGPRVQLFVDKDSTSGIEVMDLGVLKPGEEYKMDTYDFSAKKRIWLGVNPEGAPSILMTDKDNRQIFQAPPAK